MLSIVFIFLKGLDNLRPQYILNIGVDMAGMAVGTVLYICCLIDVQRTGVRSLYFFYLINVSFVGLFTDLVAWIVDEVPALRIVNLIDNTLYYMTMPAAAFFFWLYARDVLGLKEGYGKLITKVMKYCLYASLFLCFLNMFLGFYFKVDESGVYSREDYYPLFMLYAFIATGVTVFAIIKFRKRLHFYQIFLLLLYIIMPFVVSIFTMYSYGLSFNYGVIMLVLLLMYCVINISQGRDKVIADRDLATASTIQEAVLPHIFPPFPERNEFELFASMDAAKEVGGDFYDFFFIDDDHLALVIADVSGKGVPASLFMMVSKILIKSHLLAGESPGEALENVNNILLEGNTMNMFVTVWIGVIEISTGKGIAVNAGHEHPVIRRAGGKFEIVKYRHSPAVSIMEDVPFKEHEFELNSGDTLFVYTDGVPEATDSADQLFGSDRMLESLNKDPDASPENILLNVRAGIDTFVAGAEQFDDITMLCFKKM
ncbi:MAG: serine/threonine-protein phosphatase [Eubacterium sp.]|nr:serine/threonine-protein phosphatase [Eubacterium sp.]